MNFSSCHITCSQASHLPIGVLLYNITEGLSGLGQPCATVTRDQCAYAMQNACDTEGMRACMYILCAR